MSSTKSDIGKLFRKLEKYGYKVIGFGDKRRLRTASVGWVDNVIFNKKYLVFVEVKSADTKDTLSEKQKETAAMLSAISAINKTVFYLQIKSYIEAQNLFDRILQGEL